MAWRRQAQLDMGEWMDGDGARRPARRPHTRIQYMHTRLQRTWRARRARVSYTDTAFEQRRRYRRAHLLVAAEEIMVALVQSNGAGDDT